MLDQNPAAMSSGLHGSVRRARERRRGAAALMAAVRAGVTADGEPRAARERLQEELRTTLQARSVILRDEPPPLLAPNTLCFDVPFGGREGRARLEILFDTARPLDNWSCQIIEAATHLGALILELERATGRLLVGAARRQGDGAAPLIGSSEAIRRVRERIERVAATDFTILIEGESGPQPHPNFIEVFVGAALRDRDRPLEGAGKAASRPTGAPPVMFGNGRPSGIGRRAERRIGPHSHCSLIGLR
jgi:hypothetical protein